MSRIAIVSNRLPSMNGNDAPAGGLAVSLRATLERSGGTWLGWDGAVTTDPVHGVRIQRSDPYTVASLSLSEREHAEYYLGFANRTLWPLFHGRTDLVRFSLSELATYHTVNERFAIELAEKAETHDLIWVHDYHLFFLGVELRRRGIELPIGFFLHVPFPAPETLAALPFHRELIGALSAYDLVGFQTESDLRNFQEFVVHHLGGVVSGDGDVFAFGRRFRADVFPVGIDTRRFAELAGSNDAAEPRNEFGDGDAARFAVIGADRLDYTKGLPHRLQAFERLLEMAPAHRGRTFLVQIAAPSREEIPEYAELKNELDLLSGRINARHATIDWMPVRYINRAFSQAHLAKLFRLSRVGLITPLRDGMNLVAKEYVAAQSAEDPGVLVLSRFAGAAERLKGALLVNPYDVDDIAKAMQRALDMSRGERRERWSAMMVELMAHDVHAWRDDFLHALRARDTASALSTRLTSSLRARRPGRFLAIPRRSGRTRAPAGHGQP